MTLNEALELLLPRLEEKTHPLLQVRTEGSTGVVLLSTDKTLCGSLNTNLFRTTLSFIKDRKNLSFYTMGRQGRQFTVKSGLNLAADFENSDLVQFRQASQMAKMLVESFLKGELKEAYILYPNFVSALRQEPTAAKVLPIDIESLVQTLTPELQDKKTSTSHTQQPTINQASEFIFEPSLDDLLEFVLNHYVQVKIYQAMVETKASEHSARMLAMQNATDNAKELVDDLTLSYNQTRQAAITNELLEITSAQAALE